jgi:hypothetical protein
MFYPKCPQPGCGGKVTTDESTSADRTLIQGKHALAVAGIAYPPLMLALAAFGAGNFLWKRCPGGGAKRCTSCNHRFN